MVQFDLLFSVCREANKGYQKVPERTQQHNKKETTCCDFYSNIFHNDDLQGSAHPCSSQKFSDTESWFAGIHRTG